ncbi:MAG: TetR family transcriptional regulator [Solirubrobacteraceae bacterium]
MTQIHTMEVNVRTPDDGGTVPRGRTQAQRREHTRQALLDAALGQMDAGESFDAVSLRSVARAAGVVPSAFYRHFASMDELGLALVEQSFRTLRAMLREAREREPSLEPVIRRSVQILVSHVREHRQHFAFVARARCTANSVLRAAIRHEIALFTTELGTDLARFPILREWSTEDLQMLAGLLVNTMIATAEAILELPPAGLREPGATPGIRAAGRAARPEAEAQLARVAEKQLRLTMLAVPHWRSGRAGDADR